MPPGKTDDAVHSDAVLMGKIGSGDVEAFQRLMSQQSPRLIKLAYGIVGQLDEAEDIAQEALLTLWQKAPEWQPRATIAAYLRTVATRRAIDTIRRRKFRIDDYQWDDVPDPGQNPLQQLESSQDMALVLGHLNELPERQRAALILAHFEDLSHQQAAEAMDIEVDVYSSLLARARKALREKLHQGSGENEND